MHSAAAARGANPSTHDPSQAPSAQTRPGRPMTVSRCPSFERLSGEAPTRRCRWFRSWLVPGDLLYSRPTVCSRSGQLEAAHIDETIELDFMAAASPRCCCMRRLLYKEPMKMYLRLERLLRCLDRSSGRAK